MMYRRAVGFLAAGGLALLAVPAWGQQDSAAACVKPESQQGVLLQQLVEDLARGVASARKAGDRSRVLALADQAQDTRLCRMPPELTIAQAEALVAADRSCDAAAPLDQYFATAKPGDKDYSLAEDLFEQVGAARDEGLCEKPVGGVALAAPKEDAAPSHEDVAAPAEGQAGDGSLRDNYRGGELNEGRMAFDSGNYARAAELFSIVIRQAPESFEGYARRAEANARMNRVDDAIADYSRAMQLAPARGYLVADFARFLLAQNQTEDALALYNDYLTRFPGDYQVLKERAVARMKLGLIDLALEDFGKAIDLAPGNVELRLLRAFLYHDNGRFQEAIGDYTAAIRAGASGADVYYRRALAYYALGRSAEGIADLTKAIAANPSLAGAYTARASFYQNSGDGAAAIADYSRVIELQPQNAQAYLDRAREYQRQLNLPAAINDFSSALRFDPGNLEALKGRAVLYQEQGNFANAVDDLSQLIDRDYVDADAYARRGWLYYNWKDYPRAGQDFDRALTVDPNNTQAKLGVQAVQDAVAAQEKAAAEAARKRR
jgi:tetratricopeptide (TPR) repeat protein